MSLEPFFNPKTVAVVGVSRQARKVGHVIFKNFIDSEFEGKVFPVNPKAEKILNSKAYPSVKEIPGELDLVVIAVPAASVPFVIDDCLAKEAKAATGSEAEVHHPRKETYFCAPDPKRKAELEKKGFNVTDMLYEMQQMKWKEHQVSQEQAPLESKTQFKQRIVDQYKRLKADNRKEKKIVFIWNREARRCDLIVDRRKHGSESAARNDDT